MAVSDINIWKFWNMTYNYPYYFAYILAPLYQTEMFLYFRQTNGFRIPPFKGYLCQPSSSMFVTREIEPKPKWVFFLDTLYICNLNAAL